MSLSNKITCPIGATGVTDWIYKGDVKEFIERCIKRFKSINDSMAEMIIKEEAGEKLCVNSQKSEEKS